HVRAEEQGPRGSRRHRPQPVFVVAQIRSSSTHRVSIERFKRQTLPHDGKVLPMGQEAESERQDRDVQLARELFSLSERVEVLEREVAQLRGGASYKPPAA